MTEARSPWLRSRAPRWELPALAAVLLLALLLRVAALDVFATSDEERWHTRSEAFAQALSQHDWEATYQSEHPGVLTMWVGTAALYLEPWQDAIARLAELSRPLARAAAPTPGTGLPALTVRARLVLSLVTWLGVISLWLLLRRLLDPLSALLGTALVALDPFLLAHSRLHHLDALLTTCFALSVVSLLVYQFAGRKRRYLVISGAIAGLAIANKSPGLYMLPWGALSLGLPAVAGMLHAASGDGLEPRLRRLLPIAGDYALWLLCAAGTLFAVWPALWVDAAGVAQRVLGGAIGYAENPHANLNYFWFAPRPDPGPLMYPVAWVFRSTPWVLLGLFGLWAAWHHARPRPEETAPNGDSDTPDLRWPIVLLGLCALGFGLFMTLGAKKFDRYLLPVFPLAAVLAGIGWVALVRRVRLPAGRWAAAFPGLVVGGVLMAQLAMVLPTSPYFLSFYNPALGGGHAASRVLLVGWGEGLDRAAAYLNAKPDAQDLLVSSWHTTEFRSFFLGEVHCTADALSLAAPDYYVFYQSVLQRDHVPNVSSHYVGALEPEHVVALNGTEYAWIYANTLYQEATQKVLAYIETRSDPDHDALLFDVNAAAARHYAGPLPVERLSGVAREDYVLVSLQRMVRALPAERRARLWHVTFPDTAEATSPIVRATLERYGHMVDAVEVDGVRATCYALPADVPFVLTAEPEHPVYVRLGDSILLMGFDYSQETLHPGDTLRLRLYWRALQPVETGYTVFAHLLDGDGEKRAQIDNLSQGGALPSNLWLPDEVIVDDYVFEMPADAPPGEYSVALGMYDYYGNRQRLPITDPHGNELPGDVLTLRDLRVEPRP